MSAPQQVFESRNRAKPPRPFKFGPLTESRLDKAVDRVSSPYSKRFPAFLALSPGERIAISGQRDSHVTFVGMEGLSLHYRAHSGHELLRPLKRISFGLRYDIYSAGYWTRENVQATIPGSLVTNFKPEGVSRVQSAEIVVFDKKTGSVFPMWLSLGVNQDRILERDIPPPPATAPLPPRTERTVMRAEMRPKPDTQAPPTVGMMGLEDAMMVATETFRKKTLKSPISEVKIIAGSLVLAVAGQTVVVKREGDIIIAKYHEDGKQREAIISPEAIRHDQSHYVTHGGSQYNFVYSVFRLRTREKLDHSEVLVFASIYASDGKHYGTLVFGAA